jgi:hypothetical protein
VLSQVQPPPLTTPLPQIKVLNTIPTSYFAKARRKIQKSIREETTQAKINKVFKALNIIAAKASIIEHKYNSLERVIKLDKATTAKKRGLNLQEGDA